MFERETLRRMLQVNENLWKDIEMLEGQWDDLNPSAQVEELNAMSRRIRLLARLLRNVRENGPGAKRT